MRRILTATLLALALGGSSCATVVGTAAGPVTGPLHLHANMHGIEPWFWPIAYPLSVPFGVFAGFATGAAADWGYLVSGFEYGAPGHPHFGAVWNPMSADWGRYRPDRILEEHGAEPVATR